MNICLIGKGVITEADMNGIINSYYSMSDILISLRNEQVCMGLTELSSKITILESDQDIVDLSEEIILAAFPEQAEEVLVQLDFAENA